MAATMRPGVAFFLSKFQYSAQAVRTAGATWMTVTLSGSASASSTISVSSRSRRAPVGQCVMHWPQIVQSESLMLRLWDTSMFVLEPVPSMSQICMSWILSQTCTQRMHLMHLAMSRTRGKLFGQSASLTSLLYVCFKMPRSFATVCSSQLPERTQVAHRQSCWERISSTMALRDLRTRWLFV